MSSNKRIYLVQQGDVGRLVNAATAASARGHVAKDTIEVRIPTSAETYQFAKDGLAVEEVGDQAEAGQTEGSAE